MKDVLPDQRGAAPTHPAQPSARTQRRLIGVISPGDLDHARELLGDAWDLAERIQGTVAVCTPHDDPALHEQLYAHGGDEITVLEGADRGPNHLLAGLAAWWRDHCPRIVFAASTGDDRAIAARLAVRCRAKLISPALSAIARGDQIEVTALNADGRRARQILLTEDEPAIVTFRPGVGQPRRARHERAGTCQRLSVHPQSEAVTFLESLPADPASADIVHLPRLISGGRGVGGKEGFDVLRKVARRLDAGIAASRMAVDLGWIERERQVGQTGKTVHPELYIACGISGASHHRDGMAQSRHILALNTDPVAPIFEIAHLGLVSDWRATLERLLERMELSSESPSSSGSVGLS